MGGKIKIPRTQTLKVSTGLYNRLREPTPKDKVPQATISFEFAQENYFQKAPQ